MRRRTFNNLTKKHDVSTSFPYESHKVLFWYFIFTCLRSVHLSKHVQFLKHESDSYSIFQRVSIECCHYFEPCCGLALSWTLKPIDEMSWKEKKHPNLQLFIISLLLFPLYEKKVTGKQILIWCKQPSVITVPVCENGLQLQINTKKESMVVCF